MIPRLIVAAVALVLLSAQAEPAPEPLQPNIETICTEIVKDRTELMDDCRAAEELAFIFVLSWLQQHGLLTAEGAIDSSALLEAQLDPLLPASDTPAAAALFCFETSPEWVSLQQCLEAMASAPGFGPLDPSLDPLFGN
jgi:hypothetical protein